MTLRTPILDDRSYRQLRDELVARIPVYAPEWTDHHPSDPGITLIELFAFLGENVLYRFNQIPDATRLAFLDLLQVPLRPATAASAIVTLATDRFDVPLVEHHSELRAGKIIFSALDEVSVLPLSGRAAIRARVGIPDDEESYEYVARASAALGLSVEEVATYETVFASGDPLQPGGDVLDPTVRATIDGMLWLALLAPDEAGRDAARDALAERELSVGYVPAQQVPTMAEVDACPGGANASPTPPMEWQISTTVAVTGSDGREDPLWRRLEVAGDTTRGLTATGTVRLSMPADVHDIGVFSPADDDAEGSGDQPPLVEDEEIAPRLVAWLRTYRPDDSSLPAVEWLGVNATRTEQAVVAAPELLGTGNGQPDQEMRLVHGSVLGSDLHLEVEEAGPVPRWTRWQVVSDFRGSNIDDRHAVLDAEAGTIRFGDGLRGRPPQLGERVRTRSYRYGGGAEGNVAPGAITKTAVAGVSATNPLPARGGAEPETTAEGVQRIPEELRRRDRAVTPSDFSELARATPGAGIVRADSLPLFHPRNVEQDVPGAVTVVVWPASDRHNPTAPRPDRSQLAAVCRHLDDRRLVTTELYVVPPTYRRIAVSVGIAVKPGFGTEAVRRWVEQLLRQYLSPLPPFGPEGGGWPLGRRVHGPELEAAALQVEGVEYLTGLRVSAETDDGWAELTGPPTVVLERYEVPELAGIAVVPGDAPAPEPSPTPGAPGVSGPPVPVRPPREVCA